MGMRARTLVFSGPLIATMALGCAEPEAPGPRVPVPLPAPIETSPPELPRPPPPPPVALLPTPAPVPPAPVPVVPRSALLPSGFYNPMPGGVVAGYQADTGLDIAGSPRPVYALAAGTLDYSEPGHTLWTGPGDTANCVRFELDVPIPYKEHKITHVYYAHLSRLESLQREGELPRRHVEGGERLGSSGVARHSPHLHIGLLLDGEVEQQYWSTLLRADEIRKVLGGYRNGDRLPLAPE
jgi:hypothetical protein